MTRAVLAGLLVTAAFAVLFVPHVDAFCRVDYRYVEEAGASVTCREPNTDTDCWARGPGFWDPVPDVRCAGLVLPPEMAELCSIHVEASFATTVSCTTANYVEGSDCQAWTSTTDPAGTSASC